MALDKTRDVPVLGSAIVAFEDEDVAAGGGTVVAFAAALVVRVVPWAGKNANSSNSSTKMATAG